VRGVVRSRALLAAVPGRWGPAFSLAVRSALQLQSPGGVGAIGGRAAARFVCSLSHGLAAQRGPGSLPQLHSHAACAASLPPWPCVTAHGVPAAAVPACCRAQCGRVPMIRLKGEEAAVSDAEGAADAVLTFDLIGGAVLHPAAAALCMRASFCPDLAASSAAHRAQFVPLGPHPALRVRACSRRTEMGDRWLLFDCRSTVRLRKSLCECVQGWPQTFRHLLWSLGGLLVSYVVSSLLHKHVAGLSDLSRLKIAIKMYIGLLEEPPTNCILETKLRWLQVKKKIIRCFVLHILTHTHNTRTLDTHTQHKDT